MDIDVIEESTANATGSGSGSGAAGLLGLGGQWVTAPVDDAHPFDLEGYIANYSGTV